MSINKLILALAILSFVYQANAQLLGKNIENFKGRVTVPLKHGTDHAGKRMDDPMNRWRSWFWPIYPLGYLCHTRRRMGR